MIYLYYLLQNNDIKYVGLTKNIKSRQYEHKKSKPAHVFNIIKEFANVIEASNAERQHIKLHNTYENGWNQSTGGEYKHCSGYNRVGIGGVKKGTIPWNKGKYGYKIHDKKSLEKISISTTGENNPKSKIKEKDVIDIINLYKKRPDLIGVGKIMGNGLAMSYDRLFCLTYAPKYNVTPENIMRILQKKIWKNVWNKIENVNV